MTPPQMCSKHGKPRNVVVEAKGRNGGVLSFVGCSDCAAERRAGNKPAKKKESRARARASTRRF